MDNSKKVDMLKFIDQARKQQQRQERLSEGPFGVIKNLFSGISSAMDGFNKSMDEYSARMDDAKARYEDRRIQDELQYDLEQWKIYRNKYGVNCTVREYQEWRKSGKLREKITEALDKTKF